MIPNKPEDKKPDKPKILKTYGGIWFIDKSKKNEPIGFTRDEKYIKDHFGVDNQEKKQDLIRP
jgi:hypothetical protein